MTVKPPRSSVLPQFIDQAIALHQKGRLVEAECLYLLVLKAEPDQFDARHLLGLLRYHQGRHSEALELIGKALKTNPNEATALTNYGLILAALKRFEDALLSYDRALAVRPAFAEALYNRGCVLRELRRFEDALASYDKALAIRPAFAEAFCARGGVLQELKRFEDALASYDRALAIKPDHVEALNNRGNTLQELKRLEDALGSYDKALAIKPDYAEALNNRGGVLWELKRYEDALASYDKALAIKSAFAEALNNRGRVLHKLTRFEDALASYEKALAIRPDYAEALNNRGTILHELTHFEDALASYEKALAIQPDYAEALNNRGNTLQELRRFEDALASYDKALAVKPVFAEALNNRGTMLHELKRFEEALASYDKALAIKPEYAEALNNRGYTLQELKRFDEALVSYDRALAIKSDRLYGFSGLAETALKICDWKRTAWVASEIAVQVAERKLIFSPFTLLGYCDDASMQLKCASSFTQDRMPTVPKPLWRDGIWRNDRIKLAYLSADFREHAMARLVAELFERHDRSRFEVIGLSYGPDDRSELRKRLVKAFDQFHDVRLASDFEVAQFLSRIQTDVVIDLMGYTKYSRPRVLSYRPAPIAVAYLGYPGTMGTSFIDYIVVDKIVLPFSQQPFYTEKIVHLPDSYLVNDSQRRIAAETPTRATAGLPEEGFVFCCFNNSYKINPPMFDVWMRLLGRVGGSVLWLLRANETAYDRLRSEAAQRGIDPARLVFAEPKPLAEHLARHRLADLFLDTLPYNAHTTASDALWAGLPVLTCCGKSFAGRVATSLLNAVGLPELVTTALEEYEALAFRLATDASLLASFKQRLERNRLRCPLFDTDRFRRHIEVAYKTMWEFWQRGERPRSFSVEPNTQ